MTRILRHPGTLILGALLVLGLPFEFDQGGAVTGHRVVEGMNEQVHDYSWTLTPLG